MRGLRFDFRLFRMRKFGLVLGALLVLIAACDAQKSAAEAQVRRGNIPTSSKPVRTMTKPTLNSPVTVDASLFRREKAFEVQYRVVNTDKQPTFVYDRLWTLNEGQYVADREGVYRFFEKGKLNLLLGAAPLPTMMLPTFRNEPHVRRVEAGGALEGKLVVNTPVTEHNCYFDEVDPATQHDRARVVELFVEYVGAKDPSTQPSTVDPSALQITTPAVLERRRLIRTGAIAFELDVQRRTGDFSRLQAE